MISLNRYFTNPFLTKEISKSELKVFAEDHLAKVTAANKDGGYDELLTTTNVAYTNYYGQLSDGLLSQALQKAATHTMTQRWEELVKWITTKGEARVKDRADKPSALYIEFFPHGLSEFHNATVADGSTIAERFLQSTEKHNVLLGEDFVTKAGEMVESYLDARRLQMEGKGDKTLARKTGGDLKADLQNCLFDNLLALAKKCKDPEQCSLFFDQSLLEDRSEPTAPTPPPTPAAN
jgi:hypothetical protein